MNRSNAATGLLAAMALAFTASYASGEAPAAASPVAAPGAETTAADNDLAAREYRILRAIQRGRLEGWLSRPDAREKYRALGRLKLREHDLRQASGGGLSARDREGLERDLHALAQDLHWARMRAQQSHYRPH